MGSRDCGYDFVLPDGDVGGAYMASYRGRGGETEEEEASESVVEDV